MRSSRQSRGGELRYPAAKRAGAQRGRAIPKCHCSGRCPRSGSLHRSRKRHCMAKGRQAGTALALILTLSKCEVRYVIEWDFSTKRFSGGVDGTIGLRFPVLGGDNPW